MFEDDNYKNIDNKVYQYLIKKLIYLLYNIRPNISFAIKKPSKTLILK